MIKYWANQHGQGVKLSGKEASILIKAAERYKTTPKKLLNGALLILLKSNPMRC